MSGVLIAFLPDASEFFESAREELLHGSTPEGTVGLIVAFAALVALIVVLSRIFRAPESIAPAPRCDLLREAAELLKLTAGERRDLSLLAHRCGVSQPVALLLSPANLAHALEAAHNAHPDPRLANHVRSLCLKLHGVPPPGTEL